MNLPIELSKLSLASLLLLSNLQFSCGFSGESSQSRSENAVAGKELNDFLIDDFSKEDSITQSHTVGVMVKKQDGLCTAVIIAEKLILTAAHCVEGSLRNPDDFEVRLGSELQNEAQTIAVDQVYVSSDFKGSKDNKQHGTNTGDLAILVLTKSIPAGYKAVQIHPDSSALLAGTPLLFAGFGIGKGQNAESLGKLRGGVVTMTHPQFSETEFYVEQSQTSGVCKGDSGGPAFALDDGKLILVGIASRGDKNCTYSVYTNSLKILNFYNEVLAKTGS